MKKRALALALALCMVLVLLPAVSAAALTRLPQPGLAPMALPDELPQPMADTYTITMTHSGPGTAELYTTSAGAREKIYFMADPEPGYRVSFDKCGYYFKEHRLDIDYVSNNRYMITMPDGDVILNLEFVPIETESHAVTLNISDGGYALLEQKTAKKGESLFLDVTAAPGYSLESVKGRSASGWNQGYYLGKTGESDRYEILMPDEDLEIQVVFKRNGPYTITTYIDSDPAGGTLELSHDSAYELEPVTVTAVPDEGYRISALSCYHSIPQQIGENTWTFSMPRFNEEVHATFEAIVYPVSVTVEEPVRGEAWLDTEGAVFGQNVTLTCQPQEGYRVARITGVEELTDNADGTYSFTMPSEGVELKVLFLRENNPFLDVVEGNYYHDSVIWAVENGITSGVTADTFAPDNTCTRGQVVTFLWRAMGEPKATQTEHPFIDVVEGEYYYEAVLWAVEHGITTGISPDKFGPDNPCTRGQVVTFLWRTWNEPEPVAAEHPFADVVEGEYYYNAMLWAVENGITSGIDTDKFGPDNLCTRGQVVTFLYRADQLEKAEPEPEPEPMPEPEPFPGLE